MQSRFTVLATTVLVALSMCFCRVPASLAQDYSFETIVPGGGPPGPDGFFGLGATVSQEPTIGVTHLENSLKYDIGVGGFVGARTEIVPPTLNNPPGVTHVLFDLTIPVEYSDTFADIGVTVFGHDLNPGGGTSFGNLVQFIDVVQMAPLAAGTHLNQRIDLDVASTYRPGESFNQIFGTDDNDLSVASAFQFYVSKNVLTPFTLYIDNVRFVPEPSAALGLLAACGLPLLRKGRRRRRGNQDSNSGL